jgi:hypothetical protein
VPPTVLLLDVIHIVSRSFAFTAIKHDQTQLLGGRRRSNADLYSPNSEGQQHQRAKEAHQGGEETTFRFCSCRYTSALQGARKPNPSRLLANQNISSINRYLLSSSSNFNKTTSPHSIIPLLLYRDCFPNNLWIQRNFTSS